MIFFSKKGAEGIGVIISFIMVVLVVSIAASVITTTASSLESVSNEVTKDTKNKIASSVEVAQIYINKGSSVGEFVSGNANVSVVLRLRAGSDASRIDELLLQFGTPVSSQALYSSGGASFGGASFGFNYLIQGGKFKDGYINQGDVVELVFTFIGSTNIQEGDGLLLNVVHSDGGVVPVVFTAPRSLIADVVYLYP
jgi:archaellin